MERQVMHHVLQSYIPSALIVIISWFSFWLDVDAVPGRVSLCITTLLTLATQSSASRMALPQGTPHSESDFVFRQDEYEMEDYPFSVEVSYAKAIDVWMGVCMAFVFGVMIEFTAVNYLSRRSLPSHMQSDDDGTPSPMPVKRRMSSAKAKTKPGSVEFHNLLFDPSDCECTQRLRAEPLLRETSLGALGHAHLPRAPLRPASSEGDFDDAVVRGRRRGRAGHLTDDDGLIVRLFLVVFFVFNIVYWPYYILAARSARGSSKWDTVKHQLGELLTLDKKSPFQAPINP